MLITAASIIRGGAASSLLRTPRILYEAIYKTERSYDFL